MKITARTEQYQDMISRLYPFPYSKKETNKIQTALVTFQVTDACPLRCSYCYQVNKGQHRMPLEVAKKFIDMLLENDSNTQQYIDTSCCDAIIIEFIGGEPLLEIELIEQIMEYFMLRVIETNHKWQYNWYISISSNGVLYFNPEVQKFINKWKQHLSFSVSVDGNKQLHDACRVFPDGSGSYDKAIAAVHHYRDILGQYMGSKMTLAPANIKYTYEAIKSLIEDGYTEINANCVFEEGWTTEDATTLYYQLKDLANYILDNDLEEKVYISLFEEKIFCSKSLSDQANWCWAAGTPILTPSGYKPIEELKIGDEVYTADGTIHPIINTMSHFADNCIQLHLSGAFDLVCTDNHQVYAMPFDYMGNKSIKHWKPYGKYQIKDLTSKDRIELFKMPEGDKEVPYDFAYLVGRYVGDGWDVRNGDGHCICCAFDETEELIEYFNKANIKFTINKNKTVDQFQIISHPDNFELHRILRFCGHLATGKRIPQEVFQWDNSSRLAFLDGYLAADGSFDTKAEQYKLNTVSYELAQDIMLLLRSLGYSPTCYINKRGGKSQILGREVNIHNRYEVYFYKDPNKAKYVKHIDNKVWTSHLITNQAEPQEVYNITVDTNHSYIAGGIVSSNCGGSGSMIAIDWKGDIYPCLRFMESSLGPDVEPIIIGNIETGIMTDAKCRNCVQRLKSITRSSQSTQECIECPIAEGCAWCTAYNWQSQGDFNKRATYICIMHKARALANCYFWNLCYWKHKENNRMKLWLPDEECLKIISQEELDKLKLVQYPLVMS